MWEKETGGKGIFRWDVGRYNSSRLGWENHTVPTNHFSKRKHPSGFGKSRKAAGRGQGDDPGGGKVSFFFLSVF